MKLTPLFVIVIIFGTANNIRINTITNTINTIINPAAKFFQIFDIVKNGKSLYDDINDKIFGNISQEDRVMKILQEVGRISNKLEQIEMNVSMFCESFVLRSVQNVSCVIKTKISSIFR